MAVYRFKRVESVEDLLKAIGREDIPLTAAEIRQPAINDETGEVYADVEIVISDEFTLSEEDLRKLKQLMLGMGYVMLD